jgi:SAM-dependent methyltransferase
MTEAAIRRSYTEIADVYILKFGSIADVHPEDLDFIKRNLGDCDGTVLDAGCGPGHLTAYLTSLGLRARGIDLVPHFIDRARAQWPGIDFAVGSLRALDVADHSLSGILAWYSLIHCEPSELDGIFAEFRRALIPDGRLVVGFFDGDEVEPFDHKVTTAYRWPVDEMSRTLAAAGFVEVDQARRPATGDIRAHAALAARTQ